MAEMFNPPPPRGDPKRGCTARPWANGYPSRRAVGCCTCHLVPGNLMGMLP